MKVKKDGYYVIGGQYSYICYGWCRTLLGAKRLARKNQEYWDNWAGWHTPSIYEACDCWDVDEFHRGDFVPYHGTYPVAEYRNGAWREGGM